jgi:hypothetical protein
MPSFSDVTIKTYSDKSFVVIDTGRKHDESLSALGGKKNGGLTDRDSGDRFEGWIFSNKSLDKVKAWKNDGKHLKVTARDVEYSNTTSAYSSTYSSTSDNGSRQILAEVKKLREEMSMMKNLLLKIAEVTGVEFEEDEVPVVKTNRPRMLVESDEDEAPVVKTGRPRMLG